eukprot:1195887-Prorocentrum_minimum.AAC.1
MGIFPQHAPHQREVLVHFVQPLVAILLLKVGRFEERVEVHLKRVHPTTDPPDAESVSIFPQRTNQTHAARVYSHNGPIRRGKARKGEVYYRPAVLAMLVCQPEFVVQLDPAVEPDSEHGVVGRAVLRAAVVVVDAGQQREILRVHVLHLRVVNDTRARRASDIFG